MSHSQPTFLDHACVGEDCLISAIGDAETAMLALRLGVSEGERVTVISRIPGGPVVLRQGSRELALGRNICQHIQVTPLAQAINNELFHLPATKAVSCFQ